MQVSITQKDHWVNTPFGQVFARSWHPHNEEPAENIAPIILFHDSLGCVELWRDFPTRFA
ncbi:hypothetical protein D3C81_2283450 [compost metagenome]